MSERRTLKWFVILLGLILLAAWLAQPVGATDILTTDQEWAAQVAAGEAPISLVGVKGYEGVLCTMTARLASPRFPNTWDGVLAAYYAPPRALTAQEREIAIDVLVYGTECGGGPYFWALSYQDVARRGLRDGDWVTAPRVLASGREVGIHFYAQSPWGQP